MIIANLRNSREILDIKQKDVAKKMNINYSTISGWETGRDTIPIRQLIKYANLYKYSLDYLFGLSKQNNYKYIYEDLKVMGNNLRKIRKENHDTQEDIAKVLNTSQASYAHYENALNIIPTIFLYSFATKYKCSIDELFFIK